MKRLLIVAARMLVVCACVFLGVATACAQLDSEREWTDATGKFKIVGRLMEVRDGDVYIKDSKGKTLKVPIARLSNNQKPGQQSNALMSSQFTMQGLVDSN